MTMLLSIYIHEIGHCIPAWLAGVRAIPTPAKEYIMGEISNELKQYISLGGILGTVIFTAIVFTFYLKKSCKNCSALLAAAISIPAIYTLRFLIVGRGHDATEFQEAQSALGLDYSGHSLDWLFLVLVITGILMWVIKSKPSYKILGRLLIGSIVTVIFIVGFQSINNRIFDPIFLK
jgi:hypothetical protein